MKKIGYMVIVVLLSLATVGYTCDNPELTSTNGTGTAGQVYVTNGTLSDGDVNGHFVNVNTLGVVGPQGPQGVKGDTGITGPQGIQGSQGIQGIQGVAGSIGVQGDKGDKGDTGFVGSLAANGGLGGTAENLNSVGVTGEGVSVSQTGSVTTLDLNSLKTNQSTQNTTDVSNLNTTVNGNTRQTNQNTSDISTLNTGLNNEVVTRASADTTLQNNINTATNRAENAEGQLQSNIDSEAQTRAAGDAVLQNQVNTLNARTDNAEHRIDRLEQTKYLLEPTVRLYDSKHWQVQAFDSYDVRHGANFSLGARVMLKLGKSYEEKLLESKSPSFVSISGDQFRQELNSAKSLIKQQADMLKKMQVKLVTYETLQNKLVTHTDYKLLNSKE